MKKGLKISMVFFILSALAVGGIYFNYGSFLTKKNVSGIRDFVFEKDFDSVDSLFHRDDNWYWMMCNYGIEHGYDLKFVLKNNSSSSYELNRNLITKVIDINGKIAGFVAYYPLSSYSWQLLFLIVDQDFRRQGLAKKLLNFAVDDMISRGAIKIDLATRLENLKAQSLYKNFGFRSIGKTEEHQFMSYLKKF